MVLFKIVKVTRGTYPSTIVVFSVNLLSSVNTQILIFFKEKSTSLGLFFLSLVLRQLICGAGEDLNGKLLTRKWGPSSSCLLSVYFVTMSSRRGEGGRSCYITDCLRQAVTCLWVWVSSSLWYAACQALTRDWWKPKVFFKTSSKLVAGKASCRPNFSCLCLLTSSSLLRLCYKHTFSSANTFIFSIQMMTPFLFQKRMQLSVRLKKKLFFSVSPFP